MAGFIEPRQTAVGLAEVWSRCSLRARHAKARLEMLDARILDGG